MDQAMNPKHDKYSNLIMAIKEQGWAVRQSPRQKSGRYTQSIALFQKLQITIKYLMYLVTPSD